MSDTFNPIYVWAQAKDNIGDDDFYQLNGNGAVKMQDMGKIQDIVYEMGVIKTQEKSLIKKLVELVGRLFNDDSRYLKNFNSISYHKKNKKLLLEFGTEDKDVVGRTSKISVLMDLKNIQPSNVKHYINFFLKSFTKFCEVNQRKVLDIDNIQKNPDFERLLQDARRGETQKNALTLIVIIVLIVLIVFSKCIFN